MGYSKINNLANLIILIPCPYLSSQKSISTLKSAELLPLFSALDSINILTNKGVIF